MPSASQDDIKTAAQLHQSGKLEEAELIYRAILASNPKQFDANHLLGVIYLQRGDAEKAKAQIKLALTINSKDPSARSNLGNALSELKLYNEALVEYDKAVSLKIDFADAYVNRGNCLKELRNIPDAITSYDKAIALQPQRADAYLNRATALKYAKRYQEALGDFSKAIDLKPNYAEAYNNRATTLKEMKRFAEALEDYQKAITLKPDMADAHINKGNLLKDMHQLEGALEDYKRAMPLKRAESILDGSYLHVKMLLSNWENYDQLTTNLRHKVSTSQLATTPWAFLSLPSTAEEQLKCAVKYASTYHPVLPSVWTGERYNHPKIRIGYFSADYHEHATSYLMAGLFECHDKTQFETIAFSFGRNDVTPLRKRLVTAFDEFIDVSSMSDEAVSRLVREKEIDIAVDIKGFTQEARTNIFARRCAPIQVNYIGYPGTMGAPYFDYIIADRIVISDDLKKYFSERIAYLPHSYQVTDSKRIIAENTPPKSVHGLPDQGFVFCSFNNNFKITPEVFDAWMRLLKSVNGSVLWLLEANPGMTENLRKEAALRDINPARLIFAPRLAQEHHLARHCHADLFLDTFPCNAHTTASDALWAGLPVLTCMGQTFASRVAGSLLIAAGIPDLITHSLKEYEKCALNLARDPQKLAAIKTKLADNRHRCALFDTSRYTRHLEAAYKNMWRLHQDGSQPTTFEVKDFA